ncbi:hypothetical protein WJX74_007689 [Apatococcus lobatus]|uniref:Uncharacterized protein n=1 Tax=Apatococcus lobatus TaxID=904363 RepID=A0AAW1QJA9_9CHLO
MSTGALEELPSADQVSKWPALGNSDTREASYSWLRQSSSTAADMCTMYGASSGQMLSIPAAQLLMMPLAPVSSAFS